MKQSGTAFSTSPSVTPADEEANFTALRALHVAGRQENQPASIRRPRIVRVKNSVRLTPNMQRVTLEGDELVDFPGGREGAHVKLMLPAAWQSERDFRTQLSQGPKRPITRTYTVRHHRAEANELDIDFALHKHGRACHWAVSAQPGDFAALAGPGSKKLTDFTADWFLLVADMTAIPAAAAALEDMPREATGHAVFEITGPDDRQPMNAPAGIEIRWLINPAPELGACRQLETLKSLAWPSGRPSVFVASESSVMKAVRQFLSDEKGIDRKTIYASAYWKIGLREDQLRKLKDREAAQAASARL